MPRIVILGTAHPHVFPLTAEAKKGKNHEVIGVFDDDPQRLADASAKMQLPPFHTLQQALSAHPDLAIIGAVPSERAALAQAAVLAGAAVLADKPLALTYESLEQVKAAAEKSRRTVSVYYPLRGLPELLTMRQMLHAGRIGEPVRVFATGPHMLSATVRPPWHWTRQGNGGILIDIGSHYLDFCNWLLDEYPVQVNAAHVNIGHKQHPEFQDFGHASLRYPSGTLAYIEVDWLSPETAGYDSRFWIQGTLGKIEMRSGKEPSLRWWTHEVAGQTIPVDGLPSSDQWTISLIEDLAAGRPGAIPQQAVWNASRLSLQAFDSACHNES